MKVKLIILCMLWCILGLLIAYRIIGQRIIMAQQFALQLLEACPQLTLFTLGAGYATLMVLGRVSDAAQLLKVSKEAIAAAESKISKES